MPKPKVAYRPVFHIADEFLFAAFMEKLPRIETVEPLRSDEALRSRCFPGFRITDTKPDIQQLGTAYRREINQRKNARLANTLCEKWLQQSQALVSAALQSLALPQANTSEVDTWLKDVQRELAGNAGFDRLRDVIHSIASRYPPEDILIFVSIVGYDHDQGVLRDFVERQLRQAKAVGPDVDAERGRLEQEFHSAQAQLKELERSQAEVLCELEREVNAAKLVCENAIRNHHEATVRVAATYAERQDLLHQMEAIKTQILGRERALTEQTKLRDNLLRTVDGYRQETVEMNVRHERRRKLLSDSILEQANVFNRIGTSLHRLNERIREEEERRVREEEKKRVREEEETRIREEEEKRVRGLEEKRVRGLEEKRVREEEEKRVREEEEKRVREEEETRVRVLSEEREALIGEAPFRHAAEAPVPYLSKKNPEGFGNNALCYQGLQRVFRNTIVDFLRIRIPRVFPTDHAQRLKKVFGPQWDSAAENAARSREIGGTTTTIRDEYDLLGTNHFFEVFDRFYEKLFTAEAGQPAGLPKPVKSKFLGNLKAIKDGRDPLSHPVEEEVSFEEAHHLLIDAKQVLAWLGCKTQANELSALAAKLCGGKVDPPAIVRRLPSEDSIYQDFVGRGTILSDIATCFANPDKRRYLLAGDGGKGKSAIAYRFAQELSAAPGRFQLIVWLSAKRRKFQDGAPVTIDLPDFTTVDEAIDRLLQEYGAIAADFDKPLDERRQLLTGYLDTMPAFIIADDIDTVLDDDRVVSLFTYEIPHTRSSVLLTSRRSIPGIPTVVIKEFEPAEVCEFVRSRINLYGLDSAPFTQSAIAAIASATDGSPLYMDDLLRLTKILGVKTAIKVWQEKRGDAARRYALEREMEGLAVDARNVLIAAAITDDPISLAELESILTLSEDRLYFALKELETLFLFPKLRIVEGEQRFQINLNTKRLVRLVTSSSDQYARIERASKALAGKLPDVGQGIISALVRQAYLRMNAGQHAEAEAILMDAISKYPNAADLRGFLGLEYKRVGRIADARVQFDAAAKLKGCKPETFLQWIKMEISAHEWSKAISVTDKAMKIHSNVYEIAECRAYAHRQAGFDLNRGLHHEKAAKMWAEAVEQVKRAIKSPEDLESGARQLNASMFNTIVICLDMLGQFQDRDYWLERWEKEHPDDLEVARQKSILMQKDSQTASKRSFGQLARKSASS